MKIIIWIELFNLKNMFFVKKKSIMHINSIFCILIFIIRIHFIKKLKEK